MYECPDKKGWFTLHARSEHLEVGNGETEQSRKEVVCSGWSGSVSSQIWAFMLDPEFSTPDSYPVPVPIIFRHPLLFKRFPFYFFSFRFLWVFVYLYLCRPSEASTWYCVIQGGYPPQDWQSLPCAGEELDSNPGLLICSQVQSLFNPFYEKPFIFNPWAPKRSDLLIICEKFERFWFPSNQRQGSSHTLYMVHLTRQIWNQSVFGGRILSKIGPDPRSWVSARPFAIRLLSFLQSLLKGKMSNVG